ncbi:MAG: response regulator [Nitrospirae bacterium]|nr:response regulator [Nitrospirota bacterium]
MSIKNINLNEEKDTNVLCLPSNENHVNEVKILLVEDEFIIADSMRMALKYRGYTVTNIVTNGKDAIEHAKTENPDIILMDIILQNGINGIEAAIKIHDLYNIPIIYTTSYYNEQLFERAKIASPYGYLIKPCSDKDLERTIEIALNKHKLEKKLQDLNKELSDRVNQDLIKIKQIEQLLIQQSKMAEMGEMLNSIIHQWVQPLNAISLIAQDIKEAFNFNELNEVYLNKSLLLLNQQVNFMVNTIDVFRDYFKPNKEKKPFDICSTIKEVINLISKQLTASQIEILFQCEVKEEDAKEQLFIITGFPNEFKQVILNLINNAKDAILKKRRSGFFKDEEIGSICIGLSKEMMDESEMVVIKIKDNGCGIKDELRDKIFDPFVTTKGETGTGIGLYMSKVIIEGHLDGKIYAAEIKEGTMFIIELRLSNLGGN